MSRQLIDKIEQLSAEVAQVRARARRTALRQAIAVAERWEYEGGHNPLARAWREGAEAARKAIVGDLRELLAEMGRQG